MAQPSSSRSSQPPREKCEEPRDAALTNLLNETRILLPGTEVFLGFLATLPFSEHFGHLDSTQRAVYLCTFASTLLSLVLFVAPSAYHRIARPIRHKGRFKLFANRFLVAGLVPMSLSMILASYLVAHVVAKDVALYLSGAFAVLILVVWWFVPFIRAHDRTRPSAKAERFQVRGERVGDALGLRS